MYIATNVAVKDVMPDIGADKQTSGAKNIFWRSIITISNNGKEKKTN